jgi:hypothetical protein
MGGCETVSQLKGRTNVAGILRARHWEHTDVWETGRYIKTEKVTQYGLLSAMWRRVVWYIIVQVFIKLTASLFRVPNKADRRLRKLGAECSTRKQNPNIYWLIQKSGPLIPTVSQINQGYALTPNFLQTHLKRPIERALLSGFTSKIFVYTYHCNLHPPRIYHPNNIWWGHEVA